MCSSVFLDVTTISSIADCALILEVANTAPAATRVAADCVRMGERRVGEEG